MHTRCLTAVDLAEHVAIQIQFWSLAVKNIFDTDLIWIFLSYCFTSEECLHNQLLQEMQAVAINGLYSPLSLLSDK